MAVKARRSKSAPATSTDKKITCENQKDYTENQREFYRRQIVLMNTELEDAESEIESKTRECLALVEEWEHSGAGECRGRYQKALKLGENDADVKKGQPEEAGGYKCT